MKRLAMSKTSKIIYLIFSILFFTVFDLYFSELILNDLRFKVPDNGLISLISVQNTGAAFSILENSRMFLILFSIVAIIVIMSYIIRHARNFSVFAVYWTSMLIAGIACNLYERVAFGYVRDFFKLNFIDFPVFNISDMFINIGVISLIVIIVKNKYLKNNENNN